MLTLDSILAGIQSHAFVRPDYYSSLDCDDAVDQRDSHELFDSDWLEAYDATKTGWSNVPSDIRAQVDEIRKQSFLVVSAATQQHEIAGYVSDDFDLICRCKILGIEHPIVQYLRHSYQGGTFPLPAAYEPTIH
jgi:hypothetical protein